MGKYLKLFETDSERVGYEDSENYLEPYVSYVEGDNTVHYNKFVETRVVATYNVTSTSQPTIIGDYEYISTFAEIEIDGVVQPSVVYSYQFDTLGEHTVKYTLSDSTSIGRGAFQGCRSLTSVTIPNSVTSIGNGAFENCSSLTSIAILDSVASIGAAAFYSCRSLTSITIPNSVTSISDTVFYGCSGLTSVVIPNSVTSIGLSAFNGCSSLTSVTIGNGVTSIGQAAFQNCSGLTSITIPNSVTSISHTVFQSCSGLKNVTVEATTPPTLGYETFKNNASSRKIYVPSASVGTYKAAANWSTYAADIEAIQ